MTFAIRVLGAALLLATGACSSGVTAPAGGCPKVAVLSDLSELVRYRNGPGRDLTDVDFTAKFSSFAAGCKYEKDSVTVEIDVEIETGRGPAMNQGKTNFQYFAAVTNPAGEIVAKEPFTAEVEFKGNTSKLVVADELVQRIPLIDRTTGPNWKVFLGMQLTDEQRDWAKRRQVR